MLIYNQSCSTTLKILTSVCDGLARRQKFSSCNPAAGLLPSARQPVNRCAPFFPGPPVEWLAPPLWLAVADTTELFLLIWVVLPRMSRSWTGRPGPAVSPRLRVCPSESLCLTFILSALAEAPSPASTPLAPYASGPSPRALTRVLFVM